MYLSKQTASDLAAFLKGATATTEDVAEWIEILTDGPGRRKRRATEAANTRWANVQDRTAATAPGRAAMMSRFTSDDERREYFLALAKRSAETRRAKANARAQAGK